VLDRTNNLAAVLTVLRQEVATDLTAAEGESEPGCALWRCFPCAVKRLHVYRHARYCFGCRCRQSNSSNWHALAIAYLPHVLTSPTHSRANANARAAAAAAAAVSGKNKRRRSSLDGGAALLAGRPKRGSGASAAADAAAAPLVLAPTASATDAGVAMDAADEERGAVKQLWVQCDACLKWRRMPWHAGAADVPEAFRCADNAWAPQFARCDAEQEPDGDGEVWEDYVKASDMTDVDPAAAAVGGGAVPALLPGLFVDAYCAKTESWYPAKLLRVLEEEVKVHFHL
jgi:CW-type Zinc Finger